MKTEQFILAYIYGGKNEPIFFGSASLCQMQRSKLKKEPQYKNAILQVRRLEAYKNTPILRSK